jgi:hypothetical protein
MITSEEVLKLIQVLTKDRVICYYNTDLDK